jgi:hypothetical protein
VVRRRIASRNREREWASPRAFKVVTDMLAWLDAHA